MSKHDTADYARLRREGARERRQMERRPNSDWLQNSKPATVAAAAKAAAKEALTRRIAQRFDGRRVLKG